jgi:hypothetical protein
LVCPHPKSYSDRLAGQCDFSLIKCPASNN